MSDPDAGSKDGGDGPAARELPSPRSDAEPTATESAVEAATVEPWWRRRPQASWTSWDRQKIWPRLARIAIVMTLVGSWVSWSSDGPVRLSGHEGSHDG